MLVLGVSSNISWCKVSVVYHQASPLGVRQHQAGPLGVDSLHIPHHISFSSQHLYLTPPARPPASPHWSLSLMSTFLHCVLQVWNSTSLTLCKNVLWKVCIVIDILEGPVVRCKSIDRLIITVNKIFLRRTLRYSLHLSPALSLKF